MNYDADHYDSIAIGQLLKEAFDVEDLARLLQNAPELRPIHDHIKKPTSMQNLVDVVLGYCERQMLFAELLSEIEKANPRQYARYRGIVFEKVDGSQSYSQLLDQGDRFVDQLRDKVQRYAPLAKCVEALEQVDALSNAITQPYPDIHTMEAVMQWFDEECPPLSAPVLSVVLSVKSRIVTRDWERYRRLLWG